MAGREKVKKQNLDDKHFYYHKSQFYKPKSSTMALSEFTKKILGSSPGNYTAADIGCGGGANIYHLSKSLPGARWTGVDNAEKFFSIGNKYFMDKDKFRFVKGDFFKLHKLFPGKYFDIAFSLQTLSWLPGYEDPMKEIMHITRKWIFVTSLFSDFNIDLFSNVFEYNQDWSVRKDSPYNYNVYSFARFKKFCINNGAKTIIAKDFTIDIDLPVPKDRQMGTYTVKDIKGKRMQFSGPLFMPWKMVAIKMDQQAKKSSLSKERIRSC
jgi:SAM-dependent methyltransferase